MSRYQGQSIGEGGFTLLEILVLLLVSAIGLLGCAALQLGSLRYGSLSGGRQQATLMVEQLSERIRTNPAADYAQASAGLAGNCYLAGSGCLTTTPLARANFDVLEVQTMAASGGLENAAFSISRQASGGVFQGYQVVLSWQERATAMASQSASNSISVLVQP